MASGVANGTGVATGVAARSCANPSHEWARPTPTEASASNRRRFRAVVMDRERRLAGTRSDVNLVSFRDGLGGRRQPSIPTSPGSSPMCRI